MLPNETLLQKADAQLADLTSGNGNLQPATAQAFMRVLIKQAVLMGLSTVIPMRSPKQFVEKIQFGQRILRAGNESTALGVSDRASPFFSAVELNAQLFKAEVRLDNEVLQDSIEQGNLKNTVMQLMAERIAVDMDEIIVNGDTTSSDPFLAKFDGLFRQANVNTFDNTANPTNRALFKSMVKTMPSQFLRNKKSLRFITSVDSEIDYRDTQMDRATTVGDAQIQETDAPAFYSGIPLVAVPLFPENIGTSNKCTSPVLTDPKNLYVGIWRDITVETDKLIREGVMLVVATLRFDMKVAVPEATVKAVNVATS